MAAQPYTYDTTRPHLMRLFKLDLNGPDEPLSGKLLSITNIDFGMLTFTPRLWYQAFSEDLYYLFDELGDGKGYDALSYCWGDPEDPRPLRVSSISNKTSSSGRAVTDYEPHRDGTLLIQQSLRPFLEGLRRRRYNRFIWIDAICINQGSLEDKYNQIPLMRYVYEAAELVYVWLGEATAAEENAVLAMPTLNMDLRALPESHKLERTDPDSFEAVGIPAPTQEVWRALSTIATRPWWSRLWTLQEVVVAPNDPSFDKKVDYKPPNATIICGESHVQWHVFEDLISVIQAQGLEDWLLATNGRPGDTDTDNDNRHAFASLEEIRTCRRGNAGWAISLSSLLLATRRRRSTLPADMVIGQSALLDKGTIKKLGLLSAQPARDVFVRYAKHYIRQEVRECLLNHARTAEAMPGLPSWCPNFASRPETTPLTSRRLGPISAYDDDDRPAGDNTAPAFHAGFSAGEEGGGQRWAIIPRSRLFHGRLFANILRGRDSARDLYSTDDPRQVRLVEGSSDAIRLSGLAADEVAEVMVDSDGDSDSSRQASLLWHERCLSLARRTLPEGADGFDAVARTLIADGWVPADPQPCAAPYLRLRQQLQAADAAGTAAARGDLDPDVQSYAEALRRVTRRRRFFATRGGRIGLGPVDMKVGDTVAVVFYCPTPYLLRRRGGGGEGRWELVGEAYVHGIMYGEALSLLPEGRVQETTWVVE